MKTSTPTLPEIFRKARARAVPLIGIDTPDQPATMKTLVAALNGKQDTTPVVMHDLIRGLRGLTPAGIDYCNQLIRPPEPNDDNIPPQPASSMNTGNPTACLSLLAKNPAKGLIVFFSNAHRFIGNEAVAQAICNLRDIYASQPATLVLLAPSLTMPAELQRDVVILNEPLPTKDELSAELDSIVQDTKVNTPDFPDVTDEQRSAILDSMTGLASFEAKQAVALSMTKTGIDVQELWTRKVRQIEQTQGLTVYRGTERFADIGGLANAKKILGATIAGKMNISCIVFLDEIDKSFAAASTDSSGTTQDQNKALLSYIQDNKRPGILELGQPGTGKTLLAKACGNEFNKPVIFLDLGGMKSKFVGDSEGAIRNALKIIHAVSDGRALFIGACNRSDGLPPELRRRFNYCSIYFDQPDQDERASAQTLWTRKHSLTTEQCDWTAPEGWTGAEIENACLKAWATDCKLSEAAQTIVPIALSARDQILALRRASSGKYISASKPGLYEYTESAEDNEQARLDMAELIGEAFQLAAKNNQPQTTTV